MTQRPPGETDLQAMFGRLEEIRLELKEWAPGSQTPTEEMQQLRDENAQMRAVLDQAYEAMAEVVGTGPSTEKVDAAMEAIDVVLQRE